MAPALNVVMVSSGVTLTATEMKLLAVSEKNKINASSVELDIFL
jgi:hypothetical protein